MDSTKGKGDKGELVAIKYLQKNNYKIISTNFRFGRFGEIDIIAELDGITIFIEVKYRSNNKFGLPEESITKSKLHKCKKTIDYFVVKNNLSFEKIRFDVIAIDKKITSYELRHYKNIEI